MGLLLLALTLLRWVLVGFLLLMFLRAALAAATVLIRDWEPKGALRVLAEFVLTLTDPPVRFLERFLPPVRLGGLTVSTAFTVLWLAVAAMVSILP